MMIPSEAPRNRFKIDSAEFFVLAGSQRSGTNFVREALNTHPQVHVHGEVMWPSPHPAGWHTFLRTCAHRSNPPVLRADATALMDDYLAYLAEDTRRGNPMKADGLAQIGLDIKYNQFRFVGPIIQDLAEVPFLLSYLLDRRIPIVHVYRRGLLHQALSMVIADLRGVYHSYQGVALEGQIEVDPAAVIDRCHWIVEQRELFRQFTQGAIVHELVYEDVVEWSKSDPAVEASGSAPGSSGGLARFLGVDERFRGSQTLSKVIDRPYHEFLSNYASLKKVVLDSPFHGYADSI